MIGLIIALAASTAPPSTAPDSLSACEIRPDCRHVSTYEVLAEDGERVVVHVNADLEFVSDGRLRLTPGEMVTVELHKSGDDGFLAPTVVEKWSADRLPVFAADEMFSEEATATGKAPEGAAEVLDARKAPQNRVRITFRQLPGKSDSLLIVESGYDRRLDYKAVMAPMGQQREPTSVCEVLPKVPAYEHWPYPIMMIELHQFQFVEGEEGSISCD